jgi:hypothetical protein
LGEGDREARGKRQEAKEGNREQGTGNREEEGKRQEARGKRQEARGKRQEARGVYPCRRSFPSCVIGNRNYRPKLPREQHFFARIKQHFGGFYYG